MLALYWAYLQIGTEEERQQLANRLLKSLHYARMSALVLAAAIKQPPVVTSGMVPDIVWRGFFSRRDELERRFSQQLPPSRVAEADQAAYCVTVRAAFDKADAEAMAAGSRILRPVGILHGMPCKINFQRKEDGAYGVGITPGFVVDRSDALSTRNDPRWSVQDDDERSRAFEYTLVRWTMGQQTKSGKWKLYTSKASYLLSRLDITQLDYDEDGKLKVELEIEIKQHKNC
jgi:hypothetical protein